jgi:hypothetical protein
MRNRGRMVYVPLNALEELQSIVEQQGKSRAEAFLEMVKYSRVGREAENILKLDFKPLRRRR